MIFRIFDILSQHITSLYFTHKLNTKAIVMKLCDSNKYTTLTTTEWNNAKNYYSASVA